MNRSEGRRRTRNALYMGSMWDLYGIYVGSIWDLCGIYMIYKLVNEKERHQRNLHGLDLENKEQQPKTKRNV